MRLDVYSHNVKVSEIGGIEDKEALFQFCRPLVEMGLERTPGGRFRKVPLKTYAAAFKDRSQFRFHRNQVEELLQFLKLKGYHEGDQLTVVYHKPELDNFPEVVHKWHSPKKPMESRRQPEIIEYVLGPIISAMVNLQTGRGKTFVAMWCSKEIGLRTLYTFKGGFVTKWIGDLHEHFDLDDEDVIVVKGAAGLVKLMQMALDGLLTAKSIIISTRTLQDYIKDYELTSGHSQIYPVPPDRFHETLGIGFHVKDEVHMEFHLNYRIELYTHTLKSLALSATMKSSQSFKNKMYDIAYPVESRNDGGGYHVYISVSALFYSLKEPHKVKTKGMQGQYSHHVFEEYIIKSPAMLADYFKMITFVVQQRYIKVREPGQKMLIFFASVDMCTLYVEYLERLYPTLTVVRYCGTQGDSYEEFIEADIGVSTVLSAGTAVDIEDLRLTYMTTAIDSQQSNEQALGRTRELKNFPGVTPEFLYNVCFDVEKHNVYHENKKSFFKGKVVGHKEIRLPFTI